MDRLLNGLDRVALRHPDIHIKAQVGNSNFTSGRLSTLQRASVNEFEALVKGCDVFVSHAGMGNILLACKLNKPLIIMPRQTYFKEHISDHQIGTAEGLYDRDLIAVVNSPNELESAILAALDTVTLNNATHNEARKPRAELINSIKAFINND